MAGASGVTFLHLWRQSEPFIETGWVSSYKNEDASEYIVSIIHYYQLPQPYKLNGENKVTGVVKSKTRFLFFFLFLFILPDLNNSHRQHSSPQWLQYISETFEHWLMVSKHSNIYSKENWYLSWAASWLVFCVLFYINICRLFKPKSIFIQIISSISNNSV